MAVTRALRVVFAAVLDRETAAACLGRDPEVAVALWPSSLYGLLAAAATRSRIVFCRCSCLVDARLGDVLVPFECAPPAEIVQHFVQGRDVLTTRELAGLLWSLVRRREANLGFIVARLGAELEVAATRNGADRNALPLRVRKVEPPPHDMRFGHSLRLLETSAEVCALPARLR